MLTVHDITERVTPDPAGPVDENSRETELIPAPTTTRAFETTHERAVALLGLDGVWHVPRDRSDDATTTICGLRFIGEFDGLDDAELPLGEWCPDCAEQDLDLATKAVPAPLVDAAVIAVDAYQRGGDADLGGALARLASEIERARDPSSDFASTTVSERHEG